MSIVSGVSPGLQKSKSINRSTLGSRGVARISLAARSAIPKAILAAFSINVSSGSIQDSSILYALENLEKDRSKQIVGMTSKDIVRMKNWGVSVSVQGSFFGHLVALDVLCTPSRACCSEIQCGISKVYQQQRSQKLPRLCRNALVARRSHEVLNSRYNICMFVALNYSMWCKDVGSMPRCSRHSTRLQESLVLCLLQNVLHISAFHLYNLNYRTAFQQHFQHASKVLLHSL